MDDINEKNDAIVGRLRRLIVESGLSQARFGRRLGIDPGNLSRILNGHQPPGESLMNRIVVETGVSKRWLLTGEGAPHQVHHEGAPVFDIDITAGTHELTRQFSNEPPIGYINLPGVAPECPVVRVSGDSMYPTINDGSLVSIRRVRHDGLIFWGQIYLVILDDYRMVKYLRRHSDPDKVILHSSNPDYDDMEVPRDQIRALYLVETVINYKRHC